MTRRSESAVPQARPHSTLLIMFGAYLPTPSTPMWSAGLVEALARFGHTSSGARVALSRLVDRGLTDRVKRGRLVYYRMTSECVRQLRIDDERIATLGADHADEPWTIVWSELPDSAKSERAYLTRQLRFHGFGLLRDGSWIAPRDYVDEVLDTVERLDVTGRVAVFRAEPVGDVLKGPLVDNLWGLAEVAARYRAFADTYASAGSGDLCGREAFVVCTAMIQEFRTFATLDPELPARLVPHVDARDTAIRTYEAAFKRLHPPAARYFRSLVAGPNAELAVS